MTTYPVRYLVYDNVFPPKHYNIDVYFEFEKALRVAEIDGIFYTVKYHTDTPQDRGPYGHPYIFYNGEEYPVHCKGEVLHREIELNGEIEDYQAVTQICYVEI